MKLGQQVSIGVLTLTFVCCLFILVTDTDTHTDDKAELQVLLGEMHQENAALKMQLTHANRKTQMHAAMLSHSAAPLLTAQALPEEGRCPLPNSVVVGFVCGYGPLVEAAGTPVVPRHEDWYGIHQELERALKSILLNTKRNLTVVVFTNRLGLDMVRSQLFSQLHPGARRRLRLVPVLVEAAAVRRYVASVGLRWEPLQWGMAKVLMHELLPECFEWMVALDTDVVLAGDLAELWHLRHSFNSTQLVGGYQQYKSLHVGAVGAVPGVNSGVLLINLQRMRDHDLARSLLLRANHVLYPAWADPFKVAASKYSAGEQDLFNHVLAAFPAMRFDIPARWNVQGCAKFSAGQQAELTEWPGLFHLQSNCNTRAIDLWPIVLSQQSRLHRTPLSSPALCNCAERR